jgi:rSAM/selenodomain-associated transferase 1
MPEPHVIVFLKAPRLGTVKTRLAATIGEDAALAAYRLMAETVLNTLAGWPSVELRITPDDAEPELRQWIQSDWQCAPQGSGDLGNRMHRAFSEANRPAIIIGTDCPTFQIEDLIKAADALSWHDVVLGPATDGGYWLIGLTEPHPFLFENVPWSTESVLAETLARAKAAALTCHLLREQSDVDTEEDWKKWSG